MKKDAQQEGFCEIRIKGKLGARWRAWFEPMNVSLESDGTVYALSRITREGKTRTDLMSIPAPLIGIPARRARLVAE